MLYLCIVNQEPIRDTLLTDTQNFKLNLTT